MASPADTVFGPLRQAADRAGMTDFLAWWRDELVAAVPASWRERLSSGGAAFVSADGDDWRAWRPVAGQLAEAGRAGIGSLEVSSRAAAFRRLMDTAQGDAGNVWLVLAAGDALVRTVALPLAAEESLRDAVGFELDRLTPFSIEHAYFDCRVVGRDTTAQRLTLELAVASRGVVEAKLAQLREAGATVLGVGIAGDAGVATTPFNLLPVDRRERPATSSASLAARVLAGIALALAVAAMLFPLWAKREAVIELQPRLEKAKAGADVADRLAKEIEKLAAEHNFLLAKKQGQYPAVLLVEDLSRLLPDTTWVQQLDIKSGPKIRELQIAGETGSSSQLIEVIEKSGTLVNASFKSPLTKGVTPNTERFLLAAEVKPRPLPEPVPEATLVAPAPPAPVPAAGSPGAAPAAPAAPAAAAPTGAVPAVPAPPTGVVTPAAKTAAPAGTAITPPPPLPPGVMPGVPGTPIKPGTVISAPAIPPAVPAIAVPGAPAPASVPKAGPAPAVSTPPPAATPAPAKPAAQAPGQKAASVPKSAPKA